MARKRGKEQRNVNTASLEGGVMFSLGMKQTATGLRAIRGKGRKEDKPCVV